MASRLPVLYAIDVKGSALSARAVGGSIDTLGEEGDALARAAFANGKASAVALVYYDSSDPLPIVHDLQALAHLGCFFDWFDRAEGS